MKYQDYPQQPLGHELDFGTPSFTRAETSLPGNKAQEAAPATAQVQLYINGRKVQVAAGTSIMRACIEAGVHLPKLCATDSLEAFGSCRLCLVETNTSRKPLAACHALVSNDMEVTTQSAQLSKLRRGIMELYISDHPLDCLTCPANGDCELEDMAGVVGLRKVDYQPEHTHLELAKDTSNPYFTFDPAKCIVCSRCVRACDEIQNTLALSIGRRGFDSKVTPSDQQPFFDSECVSCGACVQACPTASLMENSVIEHGLGENRVLTTCAYCGVGCSFWAETQGDRVVRMTPAKSGGANEGHACVKGRFAWSYATSSDRITRPMIRDSIDQPWRTVSWDEAIAYTARRFSELKQRHGADCLGSITSSRCTNEETYLVQKFTRAVLGTNNVDTCARVCHSPTGYGLKKTFGTSAGTQDFRSVEHADVMLFIGANPTDAHPVFGSRVKRQLRQGAQAIVIDPRRIDLVQSPNIRAACHLQLKPGTNVAVLNAMAHVIVKNNLQDTAYIHARCDAELFADWMDFISESRNSPQAVEKASGVPAKSIEEAARLYAGAERGAMYYGLGVTEHSQGSSTVMAIANLAMLTGNVGRVGTGVNPLRGQNNVQGSCDMGSFPHEFPGYRHVSDAKVRKLFTDAWHVQLSADPGLRLPNMFDAALAGEFKGIYIQGEDPAQSDPNLAHVQAALAAMECVVVQDLFENETSRFAHVFLPGSSFLEKDGTFTNAERRINMVRKAIQPLAGMADWEVTQALARAMGYNMHYAHPSEIMDEIAMLTPTFAGVSYAKLDQLGSVQWPCNQQHPEGTPVMHLDEFVVGKGRFMRTEFVPTLERSSRKFPLLLTTGRILSQYNVGTQTRRTPNERWHVEDVLDIHPQDAEDRGIVNGNLVEIISRVGATKMHARVSEQVQPGVVYTTFHHPQSHANIITTDYSDWATNCPEYKVTAVQVARHYAKSA